VAAGSIDQIQTVLDSGAVPSLVALASAPGTDPEVKNEACWVVLNATSCGSDLQIEYLVAQVRARARDSEQESTQSMVTPQPTACPFFFSSVFLLLSFHCAVSL